MNRHHLALAIVARIAIPICFGSGAGCAMQDGPVALDGRFSEPEVQALQRAADEWCSATPEACLELYRGPEFRTDSVLHLPTYPAIVRTEGPCDDPRELGQHAIVSKPTGDRWAIRICQADTQDPEGIRWTALHEIGHHWIGNRHLDDPGALMFWHPTARHVTPTDVAAMTRHVPPP